MSVSKIPASATVTQQPKLETKKLPSLLKVDSKVPAKTVTVTPHAPTPKVVQQRFDFGNPSVAAGTLPELSSVRGRSHLRERPGAEDTERSSSRSRSRERSSSRSGSRERSASRHLEKMQGQSPLPQASMSMIGAIPGLSAPSSEKPSHWQSIERVMDALFAESRAKHLRSGSEVLALIQAADKSKVLGTSTSWDAALSIMFPRMSHVEQSTVEAIAKKMPESPAKIRFEERQKRELSEKVVLKVVNLNRMLTDFAKDKKPSKEKPYSLIDLKDALAESHPLFKLAWECANEQRPIILVNNPGGQSYYSEEQNMIYIRTQTPKEALHDLFRCTLTALYRDSLREITDRESYAITKASISHQAEEISRTHMQPLFSDKPAQKSSFQEHWVKNGSVIEQTRSDWDREKALRFFSQNPGFPKERFEQMQKASKA